MTWPTPPSSWRSSCALALTAKRSWPRPTRTRPRFVCLGLGPGLARPGRMGRPLTCVAAGCGCGCGRAQETLKANTERATAAGVCGVPSYQVCARARTACHDSARVAHPRHACVRARAGRRRRDRVGPGPPRRRLGHSLWLVARRQRVQAVSLAYYFDPRELIGIDMMKPYLGPLRLGNYVDCFHRQTRQKGRNRKAERFEFIQVA